MHPHSVTVGGQRISFCDAYYAYDNGFISCSEYMTTAAWQYARRRAGKYIPLVVYVNGVYCGVTRLGEKRAVTLHRLTAVRLFI